jgi:hypothetical protein
MGSNTREVLTFKSATIGGLQEGWRNFWEPLQLAAGLVKRVVARMAARLA